MGSSKTANALMARYNYLERGMKVLLLCPQQNLRDGERTIRSRIGLSAACEYVEDYIRADGTLVRADAFSGGAFDAVIVDEAQFLTREQVDTLTDIVDDDGIPVLCYGLRTDFQEKFFPGSERLMAVADTVEELKTVCWCGKKATCNARFNEQGIVRAGRQVELGGNDKYISLCRKHFKEGRLSAKG